MDSSALLLELSAADDLPAFLLAVTTHHLSPTAAAGWYSRSAAGQMGHLRRTPLHISALYNSTAILTHLISNHPNEVNITSVSDLATPLHCAAAGGAVEAAKLLISAGASTHALNSAGRSPADLIPRRSLSLFSQSVSPVITKPATDPDVNAGIYSSDEFRMYSFKVKPCSRAYSHDWTECPFAHPGENARRRDPRKFVYSCVPCPEFRKSAACRNGDGCEYAHGVFESWLHPAQYRTRLCKDETGCSRRVCFFAHRVHELRTVNPALVSASMGLPSLPTSPRPSYSEIAAAIMMMQPQQQPQPQSPGGRMKSVELDIERIGMGLEGYHSLSHSPSPRASMRMNTIAKAAAATAAAQYQSIAQQLMSGYGANPSNSSSMGLDHAVAKGMMNSRSAGFAQRSQSFIDRRGVPNAAPVWGSPGGKVDWGAKEEELSKLRRSASFGLWGGSPVEEPDVSWVHSLVKDQGFAEKEQLVA